MLARLVVLTLAGLVAGSVEDIVEEDIHVELLQTSARMEQDSRAKAKNWTDHVMSQMEKWWESGFWATRVPRFVEQPGCGKSTFQELQVTIPIWQQRNPGVDGFCHFENHAMWFNGAGDHGQSHYKTGAGGLHQGQQILLCDSTGELSTTGGPELEFAYDGGRFTWTHVRNCIDIVDDPYCYSLGWLKGQGSWDEKAMMNVTGWREIAKQECDRLQAEFQFDDEEVTVGRHVFSTPLYFRRTWNSLQGSGTPINKREHAEHVYTKCQLGGGAATGEMAYCFYKGCVLPGNRIGHFDECGYDQ
mmetsp:Transcript_78933/g.183106  ORF Transcript_78933/g.183106 Transcript_78933/m.183106 type:complete len:302 (+) Transcript_78933:112-1017(+)